MSTLTSADTLAQIDAAYADNAAYAEKNSVAKARTVLADSGTRNGTFECPVFLVVPFSSCPFSSNAPAALLT